MCSASAARTGLDFRSNAEGGRTVGASVLLPITTNYGDSVTVIPRDDGSALGFGTDLGAGFQLRWHGDTPRGSCDPNAIEQQHHQAHQGAGGRQSKMRSSRPPLNHWL